MSPDFCDHTLHQESHSGSKCNISISTIRKQDSRKKENVNPAAYGDLGEDEAARISHKPSATVQKLES